MNISSEQFAEIKGFLSGYICAGVGSEGRPWIDGLMAVMYSFDSGVPIKRDFLIDLYKETADEIHQEKLNLHEALFGQEQPLSQRAYILKKWCMGFLDGLKQGGFFIKNIPEQSELEEQITEFNGFANLDFDDLTIREEDEKMFHQVTDHVEKSTFVIYHIFHKGHSRH